MTDAATRQADEILERALADTGARDPREFYRDRLRDLKHRNPEGYEIAVRYYRETLIPSVVGGEQPPLDAWTEYGRMLAEATAPGRTVSIDQSGLAHAFDGPRAGRLVLHLPDGNVGRALLVGLPPELSPAQRASYDVLVSGKQKQRD